MLGNSQGCANAINNCGQIVGWAGADSDHGHASLWSNGTMTDLGTLAAPYNDHSCATGINASGQIVGSSYFAENNTAHAFLYSNGTMTDLNTLIDPSSGWTLEEANAINDSGWIVGTGTISGQQYAFLLTPTPEPSTIVLLTIGSIGLLAYGWRRCRAR
jgi:probable HAF family extracellular repeat protein